MLECARNQLKAYLTVSGELVLTVYSQMVNRSGTDPCQPTGPEPTIKDSSKICRISQVGDNLLTVLLQLVADPNRLDEAELVLGSELTHLGKTFFSNKKGLSHKSNVGDVLQWLLRGLGLGCSSDGRELFQRNRPQVKALALESIPNSRKAIGSTHGFQTPMTELQGWAVSGSASSSTHISPSVPMMDTV